MRRTTDNAIVTDRALRRWVFRVSRFVPEKIKTVAIAVGELKLHTLSVESTVEKVWKLRRKCEEMWRKSGEMWRNVEKVWRNVENVWRYVEKVWRNVESLKKCGESLKKCGESLKKCGESLKKISRKCEKKGKKCDQCMKFLLYVRGTIVKCMEKF